MRIALELARENPVYENIATKFFEHFLGIAAAMNNLGGKGIGLWDEDGRILLRRAAHAGRAISPAARAVAGRLDAIARGGNDRTGAARRDARTSRNDSNGI